MEEMLFVGEYADEVEGTREGDPVKELPLGIWESLPSAGLCVIGTAEGL